MPRSSRKNMKRRTMKRQRGGNSAADAALVSNSSGDSAWGYVMRTVGDLSTQINNSLMINPAQGPVAAASTETVPIGNPNANVPNLYKGGRRKGKSNGRGRKGGILGVGAVLSQAVVPFGLFGLQHTYAKNKHMIRKTRNNRK